MVADHSQESSATDPSVPVESPEADVSEGATQSPEITDASLDALDESLVESLDHPADPTVEAQETPKGSECPAGDLEKTAKEDNLEDELTGLPDDESPEMREKAPESPVADSPATVAESAELELSTVAEEASEALDAGAEESPSGDLEEAPPAKDWYILKVQVNREDTIRLALLRRIKIEGLEEHFDEIIVPTEDVVEFNKSGKRKVVRKKLYPGYILVHMAINDDTWFLIRETPGVGDFTGSAGKPTPMDARDVERILRLGAAHEDGGREIKTSIPFKSGDRVRVKGGHFQNFEGQVDSIDEANGRITVMINIFNRSTPVELEHWQVEFV
jgi:transcriptional antiterminator NusG